MKDVDKTVENKINLEFLVKQHFGGFKSLTTMLYDLEEEVDKIHDEILFASTVKRGNLDMSTLLYPFEYYGHKCGFRRRVLP